METGGVRALPAIDDWPLLMIGLALAIGILSLGFIFRVCNVEVDDSEGKTKKRNRSNGSLFGNTSSTSVKVGKYEVFLSFRGIDTRKGFADYLYNDLVDREIRTFRDDDELRVGEEIHPDLMKAIEESKIFIPIFSQNYASSKWCLDELAQIVECKRSTGQKIIPIFYDVEPRDVRKQTGSYEKAFRQHEKRFDKETVQRWKEALKEVGELKGWELQNETNGHQGKLVKIVVEEVLSQLKKNYMAVTDNLVGIDHHIEEMKRLLNVDSNDVRIVGIYGMGGLGKTTIAKFIYNELAECFDCCCFLVDVRETSQHYNGLVNLQKQLISKIRKGKSPDIANVYEGINEIKGMACNKKVLIVLDDVDDKSQFDKLVGKHNQFGSGSRIIVTTRNKEVLNLIEVDKQMYEPRPMKRDHALQLFSRHAFWSDFPPEDYYILSTLIVSTTGGLPLALEIIGSLLFRQCEEIWEGTLEKLKNKPNDQVQEILRISYEALESEEKRIFLDIACFFTGENKTLPLYMWNDCKYHPTTGINNLVLKSLVKIGDDNKFRMHDQLRDLGRAIVRQESTHPGEHSRLWIYEEALNILKRLKGTEKVEALSLQTYSGKHTFTNDEFGKLPNLRFLRVDRTDLNGDFKYLLSELRWLQWRECTEHSNPTNFHLENLVILDLSNSVITENWKGWSQIKMATKLKVLDLSFCRGLTTTPDFSTFVSLERLILKCCESLVEIDPLIGNLINLRVLDISRSGIRKLPDVIGNLINLRVLDISGSGIRKLPDAIGGLEKVEEIYASRCCHLVEIGPSMGNLINLRVLDISGSGIRKLPDAIGGLEKVEEIYASSCCHLVEIGPSMGNLINLRVLDISKSGIRKLPEAIGGLEKLEEINAKYCSHFDGVIPSTIGRLSSLRILNLDDTRICSLPMSICGLSRLQTLDLTFRCDLSQSLPELPPSLRSLRLSYYLMETLPSLSNLMNLSDLLLFHCHKLKEIQGLERLESLRYLDTTECESLKRLPDLSNLVMLKRLCLFKCNNVVQVGGLGGLKSLEILNMTGCNLFEGLLDLSNLKKLRTLVVRGWKNLTEIRGLEELESLEILDISGCRLLEKSLDLSNLQKLKKLKAGGCVKLPKIRGLEELESLTLLNISGCRAIGKLRNLPNTEIIRNAYEEIIWATDGFYLDPDPSSRSDA